MLTTYSSVGVTYFFYNLNICHSYGAFYLSYSSSINILPRWGFTDTEYFVQQKNCPSETACFWFEFKICLSKLILLPKSNV